jgi:hypothetical protein
MATICVLFRIIGHFLGASASASRSVCDALYPAPDQRVSKPRGTAGYSAKLANSAPRRED